MDDSLCACGATFTPNSYRQTRCNTCRFAPSPNPRNKLREIDVRVIRQQIVPGANLAAIGREYHVTRNNISHIKARRIWRHVS